MKIIAALILMAAPTFAMAQTQPWPGGSPGERNRYENERLRARADQREAEARLNRLETRQRVYEVEAARQLPLYIEPDLRALGTPEQERAAREAASQRRRAVVSGATQIDDWLDRSSR